MAQMISSEGLVSAAAHESHDPVETGHQMAGFDADDAAMITLTL
jgi:hypothetical protein